MMGITWAHERFDLLHLKAVYWTDRRALILADPHFGKAQAFRHAGVPVPTGTTGKTLARLSQAIRAVKPHRVWVLGDFFHSREGVSGEVLQRLSDWRRAHAYLEVVNVRGNHDRHAGDPPPELEIECVPELQVAGLRLVHDPAEAAAKPGQPVIAGHVHPAIKLDARNDRMRLPCFHLSPSCFTLPAFGTFTGAKAIEPRPGDRVYAIGPDGVAEVPIPKAERQAQTTKVGG